ncbi:MAG: FHA domain-containing protein [Thermosynechococcaceae cyanobacterium]
MLGVGVNFCRKVWFTSSRDHTKSKSLKYFFGIDVTAATPQLLVHLSTGLERQPLLGQTTWTLGRHPSNLLSFPENSISRYHAKIEILQHRHCFLVDLNSRNGSVVNQHPVSTPVFLKHGDLSSSLGINHSSLSTAYFCLRDSPRIQGRF